VPEAPEEAAAAEVVVAAAAAAAAEAEAAGVVGLVGRARPPSEDQLVQGHVVLVTVRKSKGIDDEDPPASAEAGWREQGGEPARLERGARAGDEIPSGDGPAPVVEEILEAASASGSSCGTCGIGTSSVP